MTRRHWVTLAFILAAGLMLRAAYFTTALHTPGYVWEDPDGYLKQALKLTGPDGWRWTFQAVTYTINGQRHALPPMYSVFLSIFALFPAFPLTVQIAQVLLGVVAIALVFALGRRLHSPAAGLVAAAMYAVWVPNIFNVWSTSQETLYVPVILSAFLLLLRAIDRDDGPRAFAIAGLAFGAAALTRSMPLFFAVPAACAHVWLARDRRRALRQASLFLAGFLAVTVPYSAALSDYFGQLTVIDTHGSIHVDANTGARAPGLLETAAGLWGRFADSPGSYAAECLRRARSLLHVNGGRLLQIYVVADNRSGALVWKALVHLGADALLVLSVVLAPIGAAICRKPRLAIFLVLWAAINIAIASVGGFSGARLRVPFEPVLMVLAAVVVSGGWQRPKPAGAAVAAAVAVAAAIAVLPQVPVSLRAWPDYGVQWPSIFSRQSGQFVGAAGLNVPVRNGVATVTARTTGGMPATVHVKAAGVNVGTVQFVDVDRPMRALWPDPGLAFLELEADPSDAKIPISIAVEGR